MKYWKLSEEDLLTGFQSGASLLAPLTIRSCTRESREGPSPLDARVEAGLPGASESFSFAVESKTQSTPLAVRSAMVRAKSALNQGELPLVVVPYLSADRLSELEREQVSGVDLCGNGVLVVPGKIYILRTGNPNLYPTSRPLGNPYAGRSAIVARILLTRPRWDSLKDLVAAVQGAGAKLSMGQGSKAVRTMAEDLIVSKRKNVITLREPLRLLEKLGQSYKRPTDRNRQALRLPRKGGWVKALQSDSDLKWVVSGESSVVHYAVFSQGGPRRIVVSSLPAALRLLDGAPESTASFADIELVESLDASRFFGSVTDEDGIRWASPLQTWLELQSGDARQQDAARDVRDRILKEATHGS